MRYSIIHWPVTQPYISYLSQSTFTTRFLVQVAETQWRKMQYLYMDDQGIHVMDMENYEQFCVPKASAQGVVDWLQDDLEVSGLMHEGEPIMVAMPNTNITVQVPLPLPLHPFVM